MKDTGLEGQIYPFPESPNCPPGCGALKPSLMSPGVGKSIPGEKPGARQPLSSKVKGLETQVMIPTVEAGR